MEKNKITTFAFDANAVAPATAPEIMPPGWYECRIVDAELTATRGRGAGKRIAVEFEVVSPEYKGRKIFGGFNVQNSNPEAERIGQAELSALCHATGVLVLQDLTAFKGKVCQVKIKTKRASDDDKAKGYEDKSEPCGFKPSENAAVPAALPGFMQPGASAPAPGFPPPAFPAPQAAPIPSPAWLPHPTAPGFEYNPANPAEVRPVVAAAPVPPAPPVPQAPPAPAPAPFPPSGWNPHPTAPGWFYNAANPNEMKQESDLRAMVPPAPAPAPVALPPAPVPVAGVPGIPPVATGDLPPWLQPQA